jgi:hypothetical protein
MFNFLIAGVGKFTLILYHKFNYWGFKVKVENNIKNLLFG